METDLRTLEELSTDAAVAVSKAGRLIGKRVNRDAALSHIADAYAALQMIAARIGGRDHGFTERAVKPQEEEDEAAERRADRVSVSLIDVLDEDDMEPTNAEHELAQKMRACDELHAPEHLHEFVRHQQLKVLRSMINYIWHGAKNPWEMMKRALAITRRYYRGKIKGVTMTEVARLLDEKSRCAAVSARERDTHDALLTRWGVRAPKAADGGLRGAATCAKNRARALGNTNRRGRSGSQAPHQSQSPHVGGNGDKPTAITQPRSRS